jgi:small subunit ribosomal protein S17
MIVTERTSKVRKARALQGIVTSDKMQKSRVIKIERLVKDPTYKKYLRRTTKLMCHDETNMSQVGDKVLIEASRPLSARKRFNIVKVIEKAKV